MVTPPKRPVPWGSTLSANDPQAGQRFQQTKDNDPLPDLPAALLNSADIFDYVCRTGMIYPFLPDSLKPASYPLRIGRKVIYWDDEGTLQNRELDDQEEFELRQNSLVFVTIEERLRLPYYIAMRFNLHIEFVHKGLLLGTGPLVDPGFDGILLVPIHNFTTNTYYFRQGEELIWAEFTKISHNPLWSTLQDQVRKEYGLSGTYKPFPEDKNITDPWEYLRKAMRKYKGGPVLYWKFQNSIPDVLGQTRYNAESAQKSASDSRSRLERFAGRIETAGFIAVVAVVIGAVALYTQIRTAVDDADKLASSVQGEVTALKESLGRAIIDFERNRLHDSAQYDNQLRELNGKIEILDKRIEEWRNQQKSDQRKQ